MPCTPNPTTGFFFYVPRRDVIELDITVEQAMTVIMSAGIVQPGGDAQGQEKLAALAETARAAQIARAARPDRGGMNQAVRQRPPNIGLPLAATSIVGGER